jgi:hypothetical protein
MGRASQKEDRTTWRKDVSDNDEVQRAGRDGQAIVTVGERTFEVTPDSRFTFGRSDTCTACLDPEDVGISRQAGSVELEAGTWWLVNRSTARPLAVVDDELGFRSLLAPGRRMAVEAPVTVVVDGSRGQHALKLKVPTGNGVAVPAEPRDGRSTAIGTEVVISEADRLALVALFAGYLEDYPRHDPHPRTYEAAAKRLGWPRTTLVKRVEYLRTRLQSAGVPNMTGWNALANLAEHVIAAGLLTKEDLRLLRR